MTVFRPDHTTFNRRRLQAQKFYVQLIHRGVFKHDVTKAYQVQKSLEPLAIVEAINNLFRK